MGSFLVFIACLSLVWACEQNQQKQPTIAGTVRLLESSITPGLAERPSDAIVSWRRFADQKPTLVLFSNDPFLKPVPDELISEINSTILNASDDQLLAAMNHLTPDPLVQPDMAVSAALQNNLFRKVVWVIAGSQDLTEQSSEEFKSLLITYGAISESDSPSFKRISGGFSGEILGTPVTVISADYLPEIEGPIILHIDLSHFTMLYKDEVRTPMFDMIRSVASSIQRRSWQGLAVTISLSNIDGRLPLTSRFSGFFLKDLFMDPVKITGTLPARWQRHQTALYQETFFQMESVLKLYQQNVEDDLKDAASYYGIYLAQKQMKEPEEALKALAHAASIDPVYAVEYQQLSRQAMRGNEYLLAIDMLNLAKRYQPINIFIDLQLAETYVHFDKKKPGLALLQKLKENSWSPIYYDNIAKILLKWENQLTNSPAESAEES